LVVQIPHREKALGAVECNEKGGAALDVDFGDDEGCCRGTLSNDGKSIAWSNGTTWKKE
jgi:hypothetical protein